MELDNLIGRFLDKQVEAAPTLGLDMDRLYRNRRMSAMDPGISDDNIKLSTIAILKAACAAAIIGLSALSFFHTPSLSIEIETTFEKVHARSHIQNSLEQVHKVFKATFAQGDKR